MLLARAPSPPPGPGPEQKRLAHFAGIWEFRLEMKPGPFGPGGVVTGTDDDELLRGGFFLVRRYETKSPVGEIRGLEVKEISPSLDAYASDISADGRTWTTVLDGTLKKVK